MLTPGGPVEAPKLHDCCVLLFHYPHIISLLFSLGSSLVLVTFSKVLIASPAPLYSSSASSQPTLDASVAQKEHDGDAVLRYAENPVVPGFVESSQESSGFFSEENKGPLASRKWDVQEELNSSLDADSLLGM